MATSSRDFSHVTFISAGAGSGKTYRLTRELERAMLEGGVRPAGVIGTTFTVKAAAELKERVRERLIASGHLELAAAAAEALIGTVHSVCERLLKRFAFELGLSPKLDVISIEDGQRFFNQALDDVLDIEHVRAMNAITARLDLGSWQRVVKDVADKARENDLRPDALAAMGRANADDFLAFFPAPITGELRGQLVSAVDRALGDIDLTRDPTKGTAEYVRRLRGAHYKLARSNCPWSVWLSLSTAAARKASDGIAAGVREAASVYDAHPAFHADIRGYIESVFEIAGLALECFQALKTERGLIDFLDMEQLMLRALDTDSIRERIGDELQLLMVDEFQDTNPMQLALFVKLASLADQVIFVGDVKQAIYEFRGCDPELVFETLEGMSAGAAELGKLESNWRSRPALVHYINEVFAAAFEDDIPREAVTLQPERREQTIAPAVARWTLAGRKKELRFAALAAGVADLVDSGYQVDETVTEELRPVRFGDIAVLARTNPNVEDIARALRFRRAPMKMTLSGLLSVAEVGFARACLRRLNDDTDTLATAEIIALADSAEPETWLADRLTWLQAGNPSYRWAEGTHPVVGRLKELANEVELQSPVEVVARVLNDIGIRRIVTGWGADVTTAAQRQRNLDAFLNLAVEYENHCESQHQAATLTGYLFWLDNPSSPELDLQPVITTGDAVHVLTYHKAKGLEWPVVIAVDFYYRERSNLWDARVNLNAPFDVTAPLANRMVRLWPNVFGHKSSGVAVLDAINGSQEGAECAVKGNAERTRLAYVGTTRARDLLVVALPENKPGAGAWIQSFAADFLLPGDQELELPNGQRIPTDVREFTADGAVAPVLPFGPRWFHARARSDFARARASPSAAGPRQGASVEEFVEFGERIRLGGDDMTAIGSGLHAVIAAEFVNPSRRDALRTAKAVLQGYGVASFLAAEDAVAAARRLHAFVKAHFRPTRMYVEYPVTRRAENGQVMSGWIDLALETEAGWVIIDHKASPRPKSELQDEALQHSGQLFEYRRALEAAGCDVASTWIHFAVSGALARVTGI